MEEVLREMLKKITAKITILSLMNNKKDNLLNNRD